MKKALAMCLALCMLLPGAAAFAEGAVSVQNPALFFSGFETEEEIKNASVTLQQKSLETPGAAGSEGALRTLFQSTSANHQPAYGVQYFQFQPEVEYELSMWMKFNNAENIKAPAVYILTYYDKNTNPDMKVYSDEALTTEKSSNFAAGSVWMTAEEAGFVAEDGSCKPGWHKITIPFSVQCKMLWGSYLDPAQIADYKARFLFRFGAVNDNITNPANYMEEYVASIEAEEGTADYYKSLYMDISFDDITVKQKASNAASIGSLTANASGGLRLGQDISLSYESSAADTDPVSSVLLRINSMEDGKSAAIHAESCAPSGSVSFRIPETAYGKTLSAELIAITESGAVSEAKAVDLGTVTHGVTSSLLLQENAVAWSVTTRSEKEDALGAAHAVLASYAPSGKLVDAAISPVSLKDTVSGIVTPGDDTAFIKLFVWEENSMVPVCKEKKVVVNPFAGKEEISIVYLGGSITEGVGASNSGQTSYRALVGQYFTEKYADITVNNVHQGVGGTGSDYGLMRLERDVMSYNPDLVFVEFAVNDNGVDRRLEMESIVRTLSSMKHPPYIVYLYTTRSNFADVKPYHVEVGNFYDIPQIDLQQELKEVMADTGNAVSVYLPDGVHPSDAGHKVYADKIIACMETGLYYSRPNVTAEKLMPLSGVASIDCIPAKDAARSGAWEEGTGNFSRSVMFSDTAGDSLTFTFTGNFFGIEHALNDAGGKYEVYVDGALYNTNHCYYKNINYYHSRFGCADYTLDNDTHTVEIKVLGEKGNDAASGAKVCIVNLFCGTIDR